MIFVGAISGIQDYLLDIPHTGGGQARILRARSAKIQLIAECAALRICAAGGVARDNLIFCAAGKFAAVLDEGSSDHTAKIVMEIEDWLLRCTGGRLRFSAGESCAGSLREQYEHAMKKLHRAKFNAFTGATAKGGSWCERRLCIPNAIPMDRAVEMDREFGRSPATKRWLYIVGGGVKPPGAITDILGLSLSSGDGSVPNPPKGTVALSKLAGGGAESQPYIPGIGTIPAPLAHIPQTADGVPIEFRELAGESKGAAMLGVLKADVDGLGLAIRKKMSGAVDLDPVRELSRRLHTFFTDGLRTELQKPEWRWVYCVFSGGDDMFLAGPWSMLLDFSEHFAKLLSKHFAEDSLTLSAGLAIGKPTRPVRTLAHEAEEALITAKTQPAIGYDKPKSQLAAMGGLWKWKDHSDTVGAAKNLVLWIEQKQISPTSVRKIYEMLSPQVGSAGAPGRPTSGGVAAARLAYHIARNIRRDRDDENGGARRWADSLLDAICSGSSDRRPGFDNILPQLRYAMLATRDGESEDSYAV